jgi:hypothetical protein
MALVIFAESFVRPACLAGRARLGAEVAAALQACLQLMAANASRT